MVVGGTYQGRAGVAPGGAQMPGQAGPMQSNVPSPGSGGKRPSTGVIVACRIGLTVLGFAGGLTFGMFGVSGSETGGRGSRRYERDLIKSLPDGQGDRQWRAVFR